MFEDLKAEIARLEAELGAKWDGVWAEIARLEGRNPSTEAFVASGVYTPPSEPTPITVTVVAEGSGGGSLVPPTEPPAPGPVPEMPAPEPA